MSDRFSDFMKPLKETHFSLRDYVDFPKVAANVEAISIKLNQLNYLIGQEDMVAAVKRLWEENPKVFSVLDVLIAVRAKDKKKAIDAYGNIHLVSDYFSSSEQVTAFLNETGLTEVFQKKQIKNLGTFKLNTRTGIVDSRAYSAGCYCHICIQRFSQDRQLTAWHSRLALFVLNQASLNE